MQEMVKGDRELVCGLIRDSQLGPCVMFGLGGIFTELLDDAVFRVAPISAAEAGEMLDEMRSTKILGAFRGQAPVDREALARILVALGNIGQQHETVQAIDINPVKIRNNGTPVVVDALITVQSSQLTSDRKIQKTSVSAKHSLLPFVEPKSAAIVGASASPGKPGYELLRNLLANEYRGKIYPVNPKAREILGLRVYPPSPTCRKPLIWALSFFPPKVLSGSRARAGGQGHQERGTAGRRICGTRRVRRRHPAGVSRNHPGDRDPRPGTEHLGTHLHSALLHLGFLSPGQDSSRLRLGDRPTGNFATHTMKHILTHEHFGVCRVSASATK